VATFISAVSFSRFASIKLCAWMEKRLGLTIIEYDTESEWVAIWLVINSMPGCLVESQNSSYRYANGHLPHKCPGTEGDPSPTPNASAGELCQESIPMPLSDNLETAVQVPEVKAICILVSAILGFLLAVGVGVAAGVIVSYVFYYGLYAEIVVPLGGAIGILSLWLLPWRIWSELESAAGYGQALQWAGGRRVTKCE
jgi:hypothetical protein